MKQILALDLSFSVSKKFNHYLCDFVWDETWDEPADWMIDFTMALSLEAQGMRQ